MTPETLMVVELPDEYNLLIDEFQNCFFEETIFNLIPLIQKSKSMVALTGSPLDKDHIDFL